MAPQQRILSKEEWLELKNLKEFKKVVPRRQGSDFRGLFLRPPKLKFATQNKTEEVFILLRRHWSSNINWIINLSFYVALPWLLYALFKTLGIDFLVLLGPGLSLIALLSFYSIQFGSAIRNFADWYYNLYLVTNERVIDYDFNVLATSSGASETGLDSVEDVKETSVGLLPTLFNYGDVSIYTAADKNVITFHKAPDPTFVRDKVADLAKIVKENTFNAS